MANQSNITTLAACLGLSGPLFETPVQPEFMASSRIRVMPVDGTAMEPTYRRGDFVVVLPTHEFEGEGTYVLDEGAGATIYRARRFDGGIRLTLDHPSLARIPLTYPEAYFAEVVIGFVVGKIEISEPQRLRQAVSA